MAALAGCHGSSVPTGPRSDQARIGLVEWEITSSAGRFVAGPVTLRVTNAGTTAHDLKIRGARVEKQTTLLGPGQSTTLQVDLTGERRVELWCTVPGHRAEGMDRHISVG